MYHRARVKLCVLILYDIFCARVKIYYIMHPMKLLRYHGVYNLEVLKKKYFVRYTKNLLLNMLTHESIWIGDVIELSKVQFSPIWSKTSRARVMNQSSLRNLNKKLRYYTKAEFCAFCGINYYIVPLLISKYALRTTVTKFFLP